MNKNNEPLTVDELKALKIGDWIWLVSLHFGDGWYVQICSGQKSIVFESRNYSVIPDYNTYGVNWVAYKNKEQAEAEQFSITGKKHNEIPTKSTRKKTRRKYFRKCGICGERHEQSEMIRDNGSPNGWLCYECYADAHLELDKYGMEQW